jgi:hypothetical protein
VLLRTSTSNYPIAVPVRPNNCFLQAVSRFYTYRGAIFRRAVYWLPVLHAMLIQRKLPGSSGTPRRVRSVREEDFGQVGSHQPSSKREHGPLNTASRQSSLSDKYAIDRERCRKATKSVRQLKRNGPNHVRLGWGHSGCPDDASSETCKG